MNSGHRVTMQEIRSFGSPAAHPRPHGKKTKAAGTESQEGQWVTESNWHDAGHWARQRASGHQAIRSFGSTAGAASSGKAVGTESPGTTVAL
ncbi:unnamed protein product [Staurois parvus]|uniref:Uncharacterized protein n=1 Tax=Staurois parvus TaxID=386267 RepID=A0ABN9GEC7_9NEOB|nr:unnamed protein product [Staurois parvus]